MRAIRVLLSVVCFLVVTAALGRAPAIGQELARFEGHTSDVTGVVFAPDGRWVASGARDGTVRIWDVAKKKPWRAIEAHDSVHAIACSPDGKLLASGGNDGNVKLWDPESGKELCLLAGRPEIMALGITPDGKTLFSASQDHLIHVWDLASGEEQEPLEGQPSGPAIPTP